MWKVKMCIRDSPQPTAEGGESGGYARLKTVIDGERAMNPAALLVDGGDFSIGSLIQTLYTLSLIHI